MSSGPVSLCLSCGMPRAGQHARCPDCGSALVALVVRDAIVRLPANSFPCMRCGRDDRPLAFRTWAYEGGLLFWCWDGRRSRYVCPDCARIEAAKALSFTGVLGWLSLPGILFYAWRATYVNWRAIWTHPGNPLRWGAIPAQVVIDEARRAFWEAAAEMEECLLADSPLGQLSERERATVLSASGLYETLGVPRDATREDIRRAYASLAKRTHPDLKPDDPAATERMVRLNEAWSVLSDARMRAAYDWLEERRAEEQQ